MPPILHQAPPWQPDRSEYVILWHGCTALDKASIEKGIDRSKCAAATDFGQGFYTTTLERQARQWAWNRFYQWRLANPRGTGNQAVVLRFRVCRYRLGGRRKAPPFRGLDELKSLHFVLGDYNNEDYWSLVQHCRQSTPRSINDHQRGRLGWYDMVSGPVAAFWEQRVAMDDSDQFSFHTDYGLEVLNDLIREGLKSGSNGNQTYYTWKAVVP